MIREMAVIDVGSNSVRLVAYRLDGRAMTPFLNEKIMAGLGRNLPRTGKLSAEGVERAVPALKRFRTLVAALGIETVEAVATAAVRAASDGPDFIKRVQREAGVKLRVIDGDEEARLSALGVLAGAPEAVGVVGDLGGSSLELIHVDARGPRDGHSYPLGPLALQDGGPFDADKIGAIVDKALADCPALSAGKGGAFYAVGGAWRALGRIDMALRDHPLRVLHHYEMGRTDVQRVIEFVRKQSRRSLELLEEAAAKRADSLPAAAVVLDRVLRHGGFDKVILSSYGLREGLLFEHLSASTRSDHPLVAAAEAFGATADRARAFGAALERWIAPVFEGAAPAFSPARDKVLRAAAARLADLGAGLHPDQRDEIMFDLVLRAPFSAVSHPERAYLAAAIHHRYSKSPPLNAAAYDKLLTDEQRRAAAALGAALRLGADLSGRSRELLADFRIAYVGGALTLSARAARAHLMTEHAAKRLEPLAALLGVKPVVATAGSAERRE